MVSFNRRDCGGILCGAADAEGETEGGTEVMSAKVRQMPNTQDRVLKAAIEEVLGEVKRSLQKPIYLRVDTNENGQLLIRSVEYLTVEAFAELLHVDERTVYSWIEKAAENGLRFFRPPGTRRPLFDVNHVDEWVRSNPNLEDA